MTYRALSLGGGRQSSTLALMSAAGEIERLDAVVFADTHGETDETYAWLDFLEAQLRPSGIAFVRCSAGSLLAHHLTATGRVSQMPLYTVDSATGKLGRIARRCSRDFKVRPVRRAARALMEAAGERELEQWVGISWDESERMSDAGAPAYITTRWPLCELRMTADDCLAWLAAHGYPRPPRSACYYCPQAGPPRWRAMRDHHPAEFAKAVAADEALRAHGVPGIDGEVFLSRYGPLATATFGADDGQGALFEDPDCEGGCFL